MSNVASKSNPVTYLTNANTPDYDPDDWLINPDLTAVDGVPVYYWWYDSVEDEIIEMTQTQKDDYDASIKSQDLNVFLNGGITINSTDNVWTDIETVTLTAGTQISVEVLAEYRRTDAIEFAIKKSVFIYYHDGTDAAFDVAELYDIGLSGFLDMQMVVSGLDVTLQVRGGNNEDWDITASTV